MKDTNKILIPGQEKTGVKTKKKTPVTSVRVPTSYFWVSEEKGLMLGAFKFRGENFGLSFDLSSDAGTRDKNKTQLIAILKESLDVLVHHGLDVVDSHGNIDPIKVRDAEALRYFKDPLWGSRIKALDRVILIKTINEKEALKLKFI